MESQLPVGVSIYTIFLKDNINYSVRVLSITPITAENDNQIVFVGDYSDGTWKLSTDYSEPVKKSAQELVPVQPVITEEQQWDSIRKERNVLLSNTDWIVTKYTEQNQPVPSEWVTYRQALRDITTQPLTSSFVWPTKPTST